MSRRSSSNEARRTVTFQQGSSRLKPSSPIESRSVLLTAAAGACSWLLLFSAFAPPLTIEPDPAVVISRTGKYVYGCSVLGSAFLLARPLRFIWSSWRTACAAVPLATWCMIAVA